MLTIELGDGHTHSFPFEACSFVTIMKKTAPYMVQMPGCVSGFKYTWLPNILLSCRAKIDSLSADAVHGHPITRPRIVESGESTFLYRNKK
jgi:hypothetical protein